MKGRQKTRNTRKGPEKGSRAKPAAPKASTSPKKAPTPSQRKPLPLEIRGLYAITDEQASRVKVATVRRVIKRSIPGRVSEDACELVRNYVLARVDALVEKALIIMKKLDRITLTDEHVRIALLLEADVPTEELLVLAALSGILAAVRNGSSDSETEKGPTRRSKLNSAVAESHEMQDAGAAGFVTMRAMKTLWRENADGQVFFSEPRMSQAGLLALRAVFEVLVVSIARNALQFRGKRTTLTKADVFLQIARNKPGVIPRQM